MKEFDDFCFCFFVWLFKWFWFFDCCLMFFMFLLCFLLKFCWGWFFCRMLERFRFFLFLFIWWRVLRFGFVEFLWLGWGLIFVEMGDCGLRVVLIWFGSFVVWSFVSWMLLWLMLCEECIEGWFDEMVVGGVRILLVVCFLEEVLFIWVFRIFMVFFLKLKNEKKYFVILVSCFYNVLVLEFILFMV